MSFCPEILGIGTPMTLKAHNFVKSLRGCANLKNDNKYYIHIMKDMHPNITKKLKTL
jgi:hypothetical protein